MLDIAEIVEDTIAEIPEIIANLKKSGKIKTTEVISRLYGMSKEEWDFLQEHWWDKEVRECMGFNYAYSFTYDESIRRAHLEIYPHGAVLKI